MRKKSLFLIFVLVCSFALMLMQPTVSGIDDTAYTDASAESIAVNVSTQADDATITMKDMELFLKDKKEHYPLSDEFIERYQQKDGGYIELAASLGMTINKEMHEPNQKWHFFDSWMYPKINDENDSLTWESDAKTRVYNNLLCPELLLWIYEASGVSPDKVKAAKEVAEQGRAAGTSVTSIASNMRKCVPWDDIANAILSQDYTSQKVTVIAGDGFTVTGIQSEHRVGGQVTFTVNVTDHTKEIAEVKVNNDVLTAVSGNTYKFLMPDEEVSIYVTLRDIPPKVTLSKTNLILAVGSDATVTAAVEPNGTTETAVWSVEEGNGVIAITPNGNEVTVRAIATGTAKIKIAYNENLTAECVVTVKEQGDPSLKTSVKYNLQGTSTAQIKTTDAAFSAFKLVGDGEGIISSVVQIEGVYGGGSGGSGENRWSSVDMLKFGTTSINGSITLMLNSPVSRVIITGYVHGDKCEIRVGDSNSTDWTDETDDNKTAYRSCSDMNVISKANIESGNVSAIELEFSSTSSLTIATVNAKSTKYPLYITSIEFVLDDGSTN